MQMVIPVTPCMTERLWGFVGGQCHPGNQGKLQKGVVMVVTLTRQVLKVQGML